MKDPSFLRQRVSPSDLQSALFLCGWLADKKSTGYFVVIAAAVFDLSLRIAKLEEH